jgi:hypothetical protein
MCADYGASTRSGVKIGIDKKIGLAIELHAIARRNTCSPVDWQIVRHIVKAKRIANNCNFAKWVDLLFVDNLRPEMRNLGCSEAQQILLVQGCLI